MKKIICTLAVALALATGAAFTVAAAPAPSPKEAEIGTLCGPCINTIEDAVEYAVSDEAYERAMAVRFLRKKGQEGLDALFAAYRSDIPESAISTDKIDPKLKERFERLRDVTNQVAQQFDAYTSGLFWHTDFDTAKATSKESGKPILALRLLGKLTDEYSCANSRYFRTVLYANKDVSKFLKDNFVLYWSTERPVPKISIDFGDGRSLTCTITGNSAHFVLDAKGRPVDCIPGLYGPIAFERAVGAPMKLVKALEGKDDAERSRLVKLFHTARVAEIETAFAADVAAIRADDKDFKAATPSETIKPEAGDAAFLGDVKYVDAKAAMRAAMAKSAVERPMLRAFMRYDRAALESGLDDALWAKIAERHMGESMLDEGSLALMRSEKPLPAEVASERAVGKMVIEDPFFKLVKRFQGSIALDTVHNEFQLHARIHDWFVNGEAGDDFLKLNERVYAELFLTPASDPWLGLVAPEEYKALRDAGVKEAAKETPKAEVKDIK
ncbi:MAG: hypothetical protein IT462_00080 [Planctomycetes bacterium]|nr:hypothetical protein [Planctomycetota bacterium]